MGCLEEAFLDNFFVLDCFSSHWCFMFGREICYHNYICSIGHMMHGLVRNTPSSIQNVLFASLSTFCLPPNYPRVTPVKICGPTCTTGNREVSSRMYCYSVISGILISINGLSLCYLFIFQVGILDVDLRGALAFQ